MKTERLKNLYFIFPVIVIIINCLLLGISYYIQNNLDELGAWNTAIKISEISLLIIILSFIFRIVFVYTKKINISEFFIGSILNITTFLFWMIVVSDRI